MSEFHYLFLLWSFLKCSSYFLLFHSASSMDISTFSQQVQDPRLQSTIHKVMCPKSLFFCPQTLLKPSTLCLPLSSGLIHVCVPRALEKWQIDASSLISSTRSKSVNGSQNQEIWNPSLSSHRTKLYLVSLQISLYGKFQGPMADFTNFHLNYEGSLPSFSASSISLLPLN